MYFYFSLENNVPLLSTSRYEYIFVSAVFLQYHSTDYYCRLMIKLQLLSNAK